MSLDRTALIQFLRDVAAQQATTSYGQVAERIGLDMGLPNHRREIGVILGDISEDEHRQGRPMLSAVVVASDSLTPGHGFYELAKRLGLLRDGDRDSFFIEELQRVHSYWSS